MRSDPHRPSAIEPEDYELVLSYGLATTQEGWPVPSLNINCELEIVNGAPRPHRADGMCCIIGLHRAGHKFSEHGGAGKCSVCGAAFIDGDVWRHVPTGELIHMGHTCSQKYEMLSELLPLRREYARQRGEQRRISALELTRHLKEQEKQAFLDVHPGLEEALGLDHRTIRNIAEHFRLYRSLSPAQVSLALKLAQEIFHPELAEKRIAAPTGKQTFSGTVVSCKEVNGFYGLQTKITVKISATEGFWFANGTAPAVLFDMLKKTAGDYKHGLVGCKVEISCTLESGNEPHFVFMKRPRGKLLELPKDAN